MSKCDINILILSVGRRVELVTKFQEASRRLGVDSVIVGGDCSDYAPANYFVDKKYILPRIHENGYIDSIIDLCNDEKISLIVPTIDTDLLILSKNRDHIESRCQAKVLVSNPEVISICSDKIKSQKYFKEHGFMTPEIYSLIDVKNGAGEFPLFIKPKHGSSSINAFKVNSMDELILYNQIIDEPIIQDYLDGIEFTVDVFLDFESTVITIVPRFRLEVRNGEISKGEIIKDREIMDTVLDMMKKLRPIGHITVQLKKTTKGIEFIEINPRFGGGAPMSIDSGADSCENLLRLLQGEVLEYNENFKDHLLFLRYDNSVCIDLDTGLPV